MATPALVTDPGSPEANSYATLEEATAYAEGLAGPAARAWLTLDAEVQTRALITAAIALDGEEYAGQRSFGGQALKWPRVRAKDEDGHGYPAGTVPLVVKRAQIEIAIGYGDGAADPFGAGDMDAYKAVKVGSLQVELRDAPKPGALPDHVRRMLRHVLTTGGSTVRLVRG